MSSSRAQISGMHTTTSMFAASHSKHERACACSSGVQTPSADSSISRVARAAAGAGVMYGSEGNSRASDSKASREPGVSLGSATLPSCCARGIRSAASAQSGLPSSMRSSVWLRKRG
eukprot:6346339-Prymnesium_polylepis.1